MVAIRKEFGVRLDLAQPGRSAWTAEQLAELARTGTGATIPGLEQLAALLCPAEHAALLERGLRPLIPPGMLEPWRADPPVQPPRRLPTRVQVALEPLTVELVTAAPSPPQPQSKGGRKPSAIPIEILIKVSAWLGHWGVPETLAEVERKIHDLLAEADLSAGETTVRRWATKLVDEHRREADREGP